VDDKGNDVVVLVLVVMLPLPLLTYRVGVIASV